MVQQEEESLKPFQGLCLQSGVLTIEKVQKEEETLKPFKILSYNKKLDIKITLNIFAPDLYELEEKWQ